MAKLALVNGFARMAVEAGAPTIYDQESTIGSTLTTGSSLTLPASQTYTADELEVYINNIRLTRVADYNFVGSAPRSQVNFTFDLVVGDKVRFRIDRAP